MPKGDWMTQAVELLEHPMMITLQDAVAGNGFLAGVTLYGRALMRKEDDDKWWMYGVRPAAIAESGQTPEEAFLRFRSVYKETLLDIAQDAATFEIFNAQVNRFFDEPDTDDEDARLWEQALAAIRADNIAPPEPFQKLPRESPESNPSKIEIERLDRKRRFTPKDNVSNSFARAA
jgi:hypothetical protein